MHNALLSKIATGLALVTALFACGDGPSREGPAGFSNERLHRRINTPASLASLRLAHLRCSGTDEDLSDKPFGPIEAVCLEGHGAKMVAPRGSKRDLVFRSPREGGFFEQMHMVASTYPAHAHDSSTLYATMYFLVPFDSYEVPTFSPQVSEHYLPVWKDAFLSLNAFDEKYFDSHIRVYGTSHQASPSGDSYFSVTYEFAFSWVRVALADTFSIKDSDQHITASRLISEFSRPPSERRLVKTVSFRRLRRLESIAAKTDVEQALASTSPLFTLDERQRAFLLADGTPAMSFAGVIDRADNRCLFARAHLDDGSVHNIHESMCHTIETQNSTGQPSSEIHLLPREELEPTGTSTGPGA